MRRQGADVSAGTDTIYEVLREYSLEKILPCIADPSKIRVIVKIGRDFSGIFPYIKGYLKKGIYLNDPPSFTFKREGKNITLYRDSIAITKLADEREVVEVLNHVSSVILEVMRDKDKIKPDYSTSRNISPLVIYKLLPKTNCRQCGEETCLAFIMKLIDEETTILECRPLFTARYETERGSMFEILADYGFDLPDVTSMQNGG